MQFHVFHKGEGNYETKLTDAITAAWKNEQIGAYDGSTSKSRLWDATAFMICTMNVGTKVYAGFSFCGPGEAFDWTRGADIAAGRARKRMKDAIGAEA